MFTNFSTFTESGTIAPLSSDLDTGAASDHHVVYCRAERYEVYTWITYIYMQQTNEGSLKFKDLMLAQD